MRDRYLKVILTVIAVELLWLGLRDLAPRVSAQAGPMPVVITGVQIEGADGGFLPVALVGTVRRIPPAHSDVLEPSLVHIAGPIAVEAREPLKVEVEQPLKIEADRPLKVESVPYTPGIRPGA